MKSVIEIDGLPLTKEQWKTLKQQRISCPRKKKYTRRLAKLAADRMRKRGLLVSPYKCLACGNFHVGGDMRRSTLRTVRVFCLSTKYIAKINTKRTKHVSIEHAKRESGIRASCLQRVQRTGPPLFVYVGEDLLPVRQTT